MSSSPGVVRILVDSFADEGLTNAQMGNAREIVRRLDPAQFHVSLFHVGPPDPRIAARPATRLIPLPQRRQTPRILRELLFGRHEILFYVKPSPANHIYLALRRVGPRRRVTVGTVESQSDLRNEPTVSPQAVKLWEKTVLRCDYLYSNSPAVQRSLRREYGRASEVVPTGVDTQFFVPASERAENLRPRVLFAGSLRPFKGPQTVLEAAARFPQADFALAGEGIMGEELQARVRREGLRNVSFLGGLAAPALRGHYQQSDIFLFPSSWEGSPKVILEAAACGLPVIARRNYEPESVLHERTGYLVSSDDELFLRLHDLLDQPSLRRELGAAARRHSLQFDWDGITRRWEEIFLSLRSVARYHDR
ncbi:MAG: glycosyltransferase family 4 protein [Acidobacteria bacterium]|nr:glycosyltransferase family 4 protein [Acidobacteriota bacterium]